MEKSDGANGDMLAAMPYALEPLSAHFVLPRPVLALDDRHQKLAQTNPKKDPRSRARLRKREAYLNYAEVQCARVLWQVRVIATGCAPEPRLILQRLRGLRTDVPVAPAEDAPEHASGGRTGRRWPPWLPDGSREVFNGRSRSLFTVTYRLVLKPLVSLPCHPLASRATSHRLSRVAFVRAPGGG